MIDEITYGISQEIKSFLVSTNQWNDATVLERADFQSSKMPTYGMPLVMWEEEGADDMGQQLGGATLADWKLYLDVYNYRPDLYANDPTTGSSETKKIADDIRVHFCNPWQWVSPEIAKVITDYGLNMSLSEVTKAPPLEHPDGLCKGYRIMFSMISWDLSTSTTIDPGTQVMTSVSQNDPPPFPDQL